MLNGTGWFRLLEISLDLDEKYMNYTLSGNASVMNRIRDVQQKSHVGTIPVLAGDTPARLTILKRKE